jgi:accessory gene regulator B
MIHDISVFLSNQLVQKEIVESDYRSIYEYGIELIVSSLIGITLILSIGLLWFSIADAIIFLIAFIALRATAGGYHAKSYFTCNLCSVTSFIVVSLLARSDFLTSNWLIALLSFGALILMFLSPIEHEYKPIDSQDRNKLKLFCLATFTVMSMCTLIMAHWSIHLHRQLAFTIISVVLFAILGYIEHKINRKEKKNEKDC